MSLLTEPHSYKPSESESEELYRLLVENVQDYAIFTLDIAGQINTWNDGAERIFGYAEAEVLGQSGAIIFTIEDRAANVPQQELDTARSQGQARDERWHVRKGERRFWASGAMVALRDGKGMLRGFAKVVRDYTDRKQLELQLQMTNEQLLARVEERTVQLRQLAAEIVLAEQKERERIAQLLHDDLQQQLYALKTNFSLLQMDSEANGSSLLLTSLQESEAIIEQSIQLTRQLTVELSPPVLQSEGLVGMLRWLATHMQHLYGLTVTVQVEVSSQSYRTELSMFLFQLVRELLFNVVKHAGVKKAQVFVQDVNDQLLVQISDQGMGFDSAVVLDASNPSGYGLRSIQQRLGLFHGQLVVRSQPGAGTEVTIQLPYHSPLHNTKN